LAKEASYRLPQWSPLTFPRTQLSLAIPLAGSEHFRSRRQKPSEVILTALATDNLKTIIGIVETTGKISSIAPGDDFYDAGFSSINALQLLLELEAAFDVTIPDDEFVTARTCNSLEALMSRLTQETK